MRLSHNLSQEIFFPFQPLTGLISLPLIQYPLLVGKPSEEWSTQCALVVGFHTTYEAAIFVTQPRTEHLLGLNISSPIDAIVCPRSTMFYSSCY